MGFRVWGLGFRVQGLGFRVSFLRGAGGGVAKDSREQSYFLGSRVVPFSFLFLGSRFPSKPL